MTAPDGADWVGSLFATYRRDLIVNGAVVAPGVSVGIPGASYYSCLEIHFVLGNVNECAIVSQLDDVGNYIKQDTISLVNTPAPGQPVVVRVPVVGASIFVYNASAGGANNFTVTIYGTNQPLDRPRMVGNNGPRRFTYTGALAIGQTVVMTPNPGDNLDQTGYACDVGVVWTVQTNNLTAGTTILPVFTVALPGGLVDSVYLTPGQSWTSAGGNVFGNQIPSAVPLGLVGVNLFNGTGAAQAAANYTLIILPLWST